MCFLKLKLCWLSYEGGKLKPNSAQFQVKLSAGAELDNDGSDHMHTARLLTDWASGSFYFKKGPSMNI